VLASAEIDLSQRKGPLRRLHAKLSDIRRPEAAMAKPFVFFLSLKGACTSGAQNGVWYRFCRASINGTAHRSLKTASKVGKQMKAASFKVELEANRTGNATSKPIFNLGLFAPPLGEVARLSGKCDHRRSTWKVRAGAFQAAG